MIILVVLLNKICKRDGLGILWAWPAVAWGCETEFLVLGSRGKFLRGYV